MEKEEQAFKAILGHTASSSGVHETLILEVRKGGQEGGRKVRKDGKKGGERRKKGKRWGQREEGGIEGRKLSGYSDKLRLVS